MRHIFSVLVAVSIAASMAAADPITDFVIFGQAGVEFDDHFKVVGGKVGSDNNVTIGGVSNVETAVGGGTIFTAVSSNSQFNGNIIFSGNAILGIGTKVFGDVDLGGQADIRASVQITGDLTAAGGYLPIPASASIGSITDPPPPPAAYMAPVLPAKMVIADLSGESDHIVAPGTTFTLAPGSYKTVSAGPNSKMTLTAGIYYVDSLTLGGSSSLILDVAGGDIELYVVGDVNYGPKVKASMINGVEAASKFYTEAHGGWKIGGDAHHIGIVYACDDIEFGISSNHLGQYWAEGIVKGPDHVAFEVPEPATIGLLSLGFSAMLLRRRKR